jgi:long-chain fatty acid transport protein
MSRQATTSASEPGDSRRRQPPGRQSRLRLYLQRTTPALWLVAAYATPLWAGGPAPYEIATPDLGLASAGWAARAQDAATVATNPAGMTRLDRSQVLVGVQPAYVDIHFDTAFATHGGNNGGEAGGFVPGAGLYHVTSLTPDLKLGVGTIAYASGSLDYDKDWAGRYFGQRVVLTASGITLPVAYRVNEWLSLGAGLNVLLGYLDEKAAVNNVDPRLGDGRIRYSDYTTGYGGNFGILLEPSTGTRVGLQYLTQVNLNFRDKVQLGGLGPVLENGLARRDLLNPRLHLNLDLPQSIMVSGYHELTDQWAILGDVGWQNWSKFGNFGVSVSSADTNSFTVNEHYNDTWHVALGTQYRLTPLWLLTAGVAYDSSMVNNADRKVWLPMDRQIRVGAGTQYQWNEDVTVGCAYEYANFGENKIRQTGGPLQGDLKGNYSSFNANFFDATLIWKF